MTSNFLLNFNNLSAMRPWFLVNGEYTATPINISTYIPLNVV